MKLNRHIILGALACGGVVTSIVMAFKAGSKAERILRDEYGDTFEPTLMEKAKMVLPEVVPALITAALTVGAVVVEVTGNKAEAEKLKRLIDEGKRKGELVKRQFDQYRGAVIEEDGKDTDIKYLETAKKMELANVKFDEESGEVAHYFRLTWLKEPICFWSTWERVYNALMTMNNDIVDYNGGTGWATVGQFFDLIGREDLNNEKTELAGWQRDLMEVDCDAYFLPVGVDNEVNEEGMIEIFSYWGPWDDVQKEYDEASSAGRI